MATLLPTVPGKVTNPGQPLTPGAVQGAKSPVIGPGTVVAPLTAAQIAANMAKNPPSPQHIDTVTGQASPGPTHNVDGTFSVPGISGTFTAVQAANEASAASVGLRPVGVAAISVTIPTPPAGPAADTSADVGLKTLVAAVNAKTAPTAAVLKYLQDNPLAAKGAYGSWVQQQVGTQFQTAYNLSGKDQFLALQKLGQLDTDAVYIADTTSPQGYQTVGKNVFDSLPEAIQKAFQSSWSAGQSALNAYNNQVKTQQAAINRVNQFDSDPAKYALAALKAGESTQNIYKDLTTAGFKQPDAMKLIVQGQVSVTLAKKGLDFTPANAVSSGITRNQWVGAGLDGKSYDNAVKVVQTQKVIGSDTNKYIATQLANGTSQTDIVAVLNTAGVTFTDSGGKLIPNATAVNNTALGNALAQAGYGDSTKGWNIAQAIIDKKITYAQAVSLVGIDGANTAQATVDAQVALASYLPKGFIGPPSPEQITKANISYVLDHSGTAAATLLAAGYGTDYITSVQAAAKVTATALSTIPTVLSGNKTVSGELSALLDAVQSAGYYKSGLNNTYIDVRTGVWMSSGGKVLTDKDIATLQWNNLTSAQQQQVASLYAQDLYKGNYLAEATKIMTEVSQQAGIVGQIVYSPLIATLQPIAKTTTGQKTTPLEWLQSGAMVVATALSFGGADAIIGSVSSAVSRKLVSAGLGAVDAARLGSVAGKVVVEGLGAAVASIFVAPSVPVILSPKFSVEDRITAAVFDAVMIGGLALGGLSIVKSLQSTPKVPTDLMVEAKRQQAILDKVVQTNKDFVDGQLIKDPELAKQVELAFNNMRDTLDKYANTSLALNQTQKAISDFGLAKSSGELEILESLKTTADDLQGRLSDLKSQLQSVTSTYTNLLEKGIVGLSGEPGTATELGDMSKRIVSHVNAVANQIVAPRTGVVIAGDIADVSSQLNEIKSKLTEQPTARELGDYKSMLSDLESQLASLTKEARINYLVTGETVTTLGGKSFVSEVKSLTQRLSEVNADIDRLATLTGRLNPPLETAIAKATVERDIFEAVQETTKGIEGKGLKQDYSAILSKLNDRVTSLLGLLKESGVPEDLKAKLSKVMFDLPDNISSWLEKNMSNKDVEPLQLKAGNVGDLILQLKAGIDPNMKLLGTEMDNLLSEIEHSLNHSVPEESFKLEITSKENSTVSDLEHYLAERDSLDKEFGVKAGNIVQERYAALADKLASWVARRTPDQIMDYLREKYDEEYFADHFDGKYKDLDEYLNANKVKEELWTEYNKEEAESVSSFVDDLEKELREKYSEKGPTTKPEEPQPTERGGGSVATAVKEKTEVTPKAGEVKSEEKITGEEVEQTREVSKAKEEVEKATKKVEAEEAAELAKKKAASTRSPFLLPIRPAVSTISATPFTETITNAIYETEQEIRRLQLQQQRTDLSRQQLEQLQQQLQNQLQQLQQLQTQLQTQTQLQAQTQLQTQTQSATSTKTQTQMQTQTKVQIQVQPQTQPQTQPQQQTRQQTQLQTQVQIPVQTQTKTKLPLPVSAVTSIRSKEREELREAFRGSAGWKQGKVIWALKDPWTRDDIASFSIKYPPRDFTMVKGGPQSAYRSIQAMHPEVKLPSLDIKVGFEKVHLEAPSKEPGREGAIGFKNVLHKPVDVDIDVKGTAGRRYSGKVLSEKVSVKEVASPTEEQLKHENAAMRAELEAQKAQTPEARVKRSMRKVSDLISGASVMKVL